MHDRQGYLMLPPKPFELVDEHLAAVEAEDVAMNDSFVSEEDIYRGRY